MQRLITPQAIFVLLQILRPSLIKWFNLALNLLHSPGRYWTCDCAHPPPTTPTSTAKINGIKIYATRPGFPAVLESSQWWRWLTFAPFSYDFLWDSSLPLGLVSQWPVHSFCLCLNLSLPPFPRLNSILPILLSAVPKLPFKRSIDSPYISPLSLNAHLWKLYLALQTC